MTWTMVYPMSAAARAGRRLVALGACLALAATAQTAHAQTANAQAATAPATPEAPGAPGAPGAAPAARADAATQDAVEQARRTVRATAEWIAREVDSWFGDKPFSDGGRVSDGRLSLRLLLREYESPALSLRFSARFRLPNIEEGAYFFVDRDDPREAVTDTPSTFSREQRLLRENTADRSFFAGVGVQVHDSVDYRLGFRGGLKPYAQARYRKPWQLGPSDRLEFRETLFWTADDRLGSTTVLSYEHAFSRTLTARWLNAATISQRSGKFEWASSLGAYRSFGDQRLLSFEALVNGVEGAEVPVSDFGLQLKWQQPVHKDLLIGELILGHFWPRENMQSPRGSAWALGGSLTLRF